MTTYKPGDRVLLVPGTQPIEAVMDSRNQVAVRVNEHFTALHYLDSIAALGFTVQPMPLAEPPVGSRVRLNGSTSESQPDVWEYERRADGWWCLTHSGPGCATQPYAWEDLGPVNVVAIGTPSFEWTEVTR